MAGNSLLFTREDGVEAAWRVVEPVLDDVTPVYEYRPGTWGPEESNKLLADRDDWYQPNMTK
jgi:glucose-6-phosphate 1-dehydrogenase